MKSRPPRVVHGMSKHNNPSSRPPQSPVLAAIGLTPATTATHTLDPATDPELAAELDDTPAVSRAPDVDHRPGSCISHDDAMIAKATEQRVSPAVSGSLYTTQRISRDQESAQSPSMGRVVRFHSDGRDYAATVAFVSVDGRLNLTVHNHDGSTHGARDVPEGAPGKFGWYWPPRV